MGTNRNKTLTDMVTKLEKAGVSVTVDNNPSEEKIARIERMIEQKAKLFNLFKLNNPQAN
ncbi:MAG: hypothetical protein ACPGVD_10250 [Flavobacteriales bacterium]